MIEQFDRYNTDKIINILLESKGISDICFKYRDIIKIDLQQTVSNFVNSPTFLKNKIVEDVKIFNYSFDNTEFNIDDLVLKIKLFKYKDSYCSAITNVKNSKIINGIFNDVMITLDVYIKEYDDDFFFDINSILLHEIVHCYENYKLLLNNKFRPKHWSIGSIYPQLRNRYKNKDIQNILRLLYTSLRNEIASQLHQYYDYAKHNKKYNKIYDIMRNLKEFKIDKIDLEFINELNDVRTHIYNSIKYLTKNKKYLKDLNNSIWKNPIDIENINMFINDLKTLFNNSSEYIEAKINLINKKISEINYDDKELSEAIIVDDYIIEFPVLFF